MDLTAPRSHKLTGNCSRVAPMLARVGDKWTVLIITTLDEGPMRFNALKRHIDGISQQMLTRVLKALERDGIVSRTTYPTNPPQVEYALTDLGRSLCVPVMALGDWVLDHMDAIGAAQVRYDAR